MGRRYENPPMVDDYSHVPVRHPSTSQLQTMRRLSYRVLGHADTAVEMVAEAMEQAAVTDRVNRAATAVAAGRWG